MGLTNAVIARLPAPLRRGLERIQKHPIAYRLFRGASWSLASTLISRFLGLAAAVVVARFLGKEGFGKLGIVQQALSTLGWFAGLGMGYTATKYIAEFRAKDPAKAGRVIGLTSARPVERGAPRRAPSSREVCVCAAKES